MAGGDLLVDRLVAGGFLRPAVLLRGLQLRRPALSCWRVGLVMGLSGLLVEPLAWLQSWLWARRLRKAELPDDPIDAVPWGPDDPQEDELGLARLSIDTNMAGMAFPLAYPWFFRRNVLGFSAAFERRWLHFTKLTWLHDGHGKAGLLIKNSAHSARVELVLRHFPRARFVLLRRDRQDSIRSLVQVKQRLGSLVGLQPLPDAVTQVEETVAAHRQLLEAFEASRHRIPAGQLVELPYEELIRQPFAALKRIYDELGLSSWSVAQAPLSARIAQARSYTADPVTLPLAAEQRLNDLMEEA